MKTLTLILATVLFTTAGFAQTTPDDKDFTYIPRTLSAGTSMSARSYSASYDDTTQAISTSGWSRIFVVLNTAANDSISVVCSYQGSVNGATFGPFTTLDSLSSTGTVGVNTAFELPAKAMGFEFVRVRLVYSPINRVSGSPATTLTTYIRKKRN